ncbi:MAG: hypothetical protein HQM12_08175 [SAR324 cluster bacterium]|nr:hypothetical protein [SAR324 cluster bacterium]
MKKKINPKIVFILFLFFLLSSQSCGLIDDKKSDKNTSNVTGCAPWKSSRVLSEKKEARQSHENKQEHISRRQSGGVKITATVCNLNKSKSRLLVHKDTFARQTNTDVGMNETVMQTRQNSSSDGVAAPPPPPPPEPVTDGSAAGNAGPPPGPGDDGSAAGTTGTPSAEEGPPPEKKGETQRLTPTLYKMAMVNFWLIKSDGTEVNIINPDSSNPVYSEDNPLILNFATPDDTIELLTSDTIEPGTYTGYKMQFLYIEMELPTAFHLPATSITDGWESEISATEIQSYTNTGSSFIANFRLYFNAIGKYWKRDFVVGLGDTQERYWLRRALEDRVGQKNFFIKVSNNDHPQGDGAPDNTLDLFNDEEFWGTESGYANSAIPIIVGTHSKAGGVDARLEKEFTIPEAIDEFYNIDISVDVSNTMLYELGTAPDGVSFLDNVLDLGPSKDGKSYGDEGLHPVLPQFVILTTKGEQDEAPAQKAYQLPLTCVQSGLEEAACGVEFCPSYIMGTDANDDAFCSDN